MANFELCDLNYWSFQIASIEKNSIQSIQFSYCFRDSIAPSLDICWFLLHILMTLISKPCYMPRKFFFRFDLLVFVTCSHKPRFEFIFTRDCYSQLTSCIYTLSQNSENYSFLVSYREAVIFIFFSCARLSSTSCSDSSTTLSLSAFLSQRE